MADRLNRRERLLAFIKPWADCRPAYRLRLGDVGIRHCWLTDEALEMIAGRICRDFWFERKINRQNRAISAARVA